MARLRFSRRFVRHLGACCFLGLIIYPQAVASSEEPDPPPGPEDDEELKPPGDCTKEVWRPLQKEVGRACSGSGKMECYNEDLCDTLKDKIDRFTNCITARETIMTRCFRGGDKRHRDEVGRLKTGKSNCELIQRGKCPGACPKK
jgi:hypothetical protein